MNGSSFVRLAREAFEPFMKELGFSMEVPEISGRYYRVGFNHPRHSVAISFEPGDDAFFLMVFGRTGAGLSNIDDRKKTPRLSDLNNRYMKDVSAAERASNETVFGSVSVTDPEERAMLKMAKELRLVLPRHIAETAR